MCRVGRTLVIVTLAFASACRSDPTNVKQQLAVLRKKDASTKERLRAIENLRKTGKREAAPGLAEALKSSPPKVKAEIAVVLGELKDPQSVGPLCDAIDLTPAPDKAIEIDSANEKIARALGVLGLKAATPTLLKLLSASKNHFVKFEVLSALGKLNDPSAAPVLATLALDESQEAPINQKAMAALATAGSEEHVPIFVKGLFFDRRGTVLFPDASFGLFRLRQAAFGPVLALVSGKDAETEAWAKKREVPPFALLAKGAQLEGYLRDPNAIPALVKLLKYQDEEPDHALIVQAAAADALGRMRARSAIPALLDRLKAEHRDPFVTALVRMGDRSVLPKLTACAVAGAWQSRESCIQGIVGLGGKGEAHLFDGFVQDESKRFLTECQQGQYGEVGDCGKERPRVVGERTTFLKAYKAVLQTVGSCQDAKCFADALGSADSVARQKAAYAIAQRGDLEALPALFTAIRRPAKNGGDLVARVAATLAVDWLTATNPDARARCRGELDALQAAIETEGKIAANAESADEMKHLLDVLRRGRDVGSPPPAAAVRAPESAEGPAATPAPAKAPVKKKYKKGARKTK